MSVVIRKATNKDDAIWIVKCVNKYVELSVPLQIKGVTESSDQYFIAEIDGTKVGSVAIRISRGEIRNLVVIPEYRRRGIATKLLQFAIEQLKNYDLPEIWAQVRKNNISSLQCFKKNGFKRVTKWSSPYDPTIKLFKLVFNRSRKLR